MRALVTDFAQDQLTSLIEQPVDRQDIAALLERLHGLAAVPGGNFQDPDVVRLVSGEIGDLYVVSGGHLHALVAVDADVPDQFVVTNIFAKDGQAGSTGPNERTRSLERIHA